MPLYFQFLQLVATLIVKAINIDKNKDGHISGQEILNYISMALVPLALNSNSIKEQFKAFVEHVTHLGLESLKTSLMDIVKLQLLDGQQKEAEEKIDALAGSLFKSIEGIQEIIEASKNLFGDKVIELKLTKKKK